jgi:azurin
MRTALIAFSSSLLCSTLVVSAAYRTSAVVASGDAVVSAAGAGQAAARVVQIQVGDNMKFNPAAISAAPGERLKVVITDVGKMPKMAMAHNFVLLKKGTDPKGFAEKSATSRETEFIAPALTDQVLAKTTMVGPGETAEVTFAAPTQRGDYTFICTFPGHFALGMKGLLSVK